MERRSDIALMRAARTDARAFGELYERHAVAIHGWLRARVGEPAATDLTAETFAAAWQARRRFRSDLADSVAPWLYGIALNQYRSYQRLSRVETAARIRLGMQETYASALDIEEADERLSAEQARGELRSALGELTAEQRRALELRVIGDLRFAEIAAQMSTTEPTARMRVMRALRAMRAVVGGGATTP
jgi:RNA polymerase sigma-70 factor (ECF subfamily)